MIALIFDLDGVVADTSGAHYRSWARLAEEERLRFTTIDNEALLGRNREDSLRIFAGDRVLDVATASNWLQRKQRHFLDELALMGPGDALPGVVPLIDEARAAGLPIALASSSRNARGVLEQLGLTDRFDVIADGTTPVAPKPAPDIFLYAAMMLDLPPRTCIVFEDSPAGLTAAQAGGFPVVTLGGAVVGPVHFRDLRGVTLAVLRTAF